MSKPKSTSIPAVGVAGVELADLSAVTATEEPAVGVVGVVVIAGAAARSAVLFPFSLPCSSFLLMNAMAAAAAVKVKVQVQVMYRTRTQVVRWFARSNSTTHGSNRDWEEKRVAVRVSCQCPSVRSIELSVECDAVVAVGTAAAADTCPRSNNQVRRSVRIGSALKLRLRFESAAVSALQRLRQTGRQKERAARRKLFYYPLRCLKPKLIARLRQRRSSRLRLKSDSDFT